MCTGRWRRHVHHQALWGMARRHRGITSALENDSYGLLNPRLALVREGELPDEMVSMLQLEPPSIDRVWLAESMSIPTVSARTAGEFHAHPQNAMHKKGPKLIEA